MTTLTELNRLQPEIYQVIQLFSKHQYITVQNIRDQPLVFCVSRLSIKSLHCLLFLQAIPMLYCGQELINGNFATAFLPPPPIYYPGPPRNLSPPWRPDDKDGHYVFVVGENLTPRCIFPQLNDV